MFPSFSLKKIQLVLPKIGLYLFVFETDLEESDDLFVNLKVFMS